MSQQNMGWKSKVLSSILVRDVSNPDDSMLVDMAQGTIEPGVPDKSLGLLLSKAELDLYKATGMALAQFTYNPHAGWVFKKNSDGAELFNSYIPPEWKRREHFFQTAYATPVTTPPPLFEKYLDHLTNSHTDSKEYIYDWLKTALTGRNYTILTAIGEPGIGKGKLGEVMSELFGASNFTKVRDTIFKKEFNAALRNKQLVYVDEVSITSKEEADRVKDVVNGRIEVVRKGYDAEEIDNRASFYITSNRMDAIKIEPNDRRFSIIQLTERSLLESLTPTEIDSLLDPKLIEELALYLLGRNLVNNMMKPFRSARYDEVLEAGLSDWEIYLVEDYFAKMNVGDKVTLSAVKGALTSKFPFMRRVPGRSRIEGVVKKFPKHLRMFRPFNKERQVEILSAYTPII